MKKGLYLKVAVSNLRKNYRFFIPRILTETGLIGCFYIVYTLAMDKRLSDLHGGEYVSSFMFIGIFVVALLSLILMLYTNSFLMKQRKREFGLYNVLGMEKKHINRVLFGESAVTSLISVVLGLGFGILFYKVSSLLICKLLAENIIFGFYFITPKTLIPCALFFIAIDFVTYIINCIRIGIMKPVELLKSGNVGEKEPKVKWVLLILGVLMLCSGYYISLTVLTPVKALTLFFVAVFLVIFGTYFLFAAGSIWVLKLLKKSKKYYYNKKRMPVISGLIYRMKQNAVGLASIAILATTVLVMLSTTLSLYCGLEETLKKYYPHDFSFTAYYRDANENTHYFSNDELNEFVAEAASIHNVEIENTVCEDYLEVTFLNKDGILSADTSQKGADLNNLENYIFLTADQYKVLTNETLCLSDREIAICRISSDTNALANEINSLKIGDNVYGVTNHLDHYPVKSKMGISVRNCYGIVVSDGETLSEIYNYQKQCYGTYASDYTKQILVKFTDTDEILKIGNDYADTLNKMILQKAEQNTDRTYGVFWDSVWEAKENLYGMYGTFLFLGILLGLVFLFATALIIYYKQISEGYEDRTRYQIMKKIGMSDKEVKSSVKTQILFIFFLPLLVAGCHIAFAFPMLVKLLKLLMLPNNTFFLICLICTFLVFSLIYLIIYLLTARTYYKIIR